MKSREKFEGAMFGLAAGDAFGAPYEGGLPERLVWRLLGKTRSGKLRWTDDTQMSLDLATSLIHAEQIDQDAVAARFSASYRWSRGYGPGAARVLKRIRRGEPWQVASRAVFADGSYGNGAAMRAPVIGLRFCNHLDQLDEAVKKCSEITHGHPLAIEGARLIARAVAQACNSNYPEDVWRRLQRLRWCEPFARKLERAYQWSESNQEIPIRKIREQLGNGIAATDSVVTSVFIGLSNADNDFDQLLQMAIKLGGDTDTIAAMAGSIWGAIRGIDDLPSKFQDSLEQSNDIRKAATGLWEIARPF